MANSVDHFWPTLINYFFQNTWLCFEILTFKRLGLKRISLELLPLPPLFSIATILFESIICFFSIDRKSMVDYWI
jgi:hypothetical protein